MLWVLFAVQLIAVLSVLFLENKKPGEAALWVAVISLLPGIGLVLYLCFGSTVGITMTAWLRGRRITASYRESLERQMKALAGWAEETQQEGLEKEIALFHLRDSSAAITWHNHVDMLRGGQEKYDHLFADLDAARETIHIAYYAIHNDSVGKRLAEVLAIKAAQGVKVKVLYDRIGSLMTPRRMFRALIDKGGLVRSIKPNATQFRNHRKIVVIDGTIGYVGGMNIGEKYLGRFKHKSPWRDTHLRVMGESVQLLQYYFLYDWVYAHRVGHAGITENEIRELFAKQPQAEEELACQVIASGADTFQASMKRSYLRLITAAKESIHIQSPYFVPSDSIQEALRVALSSGIGVTLMLPAQKASFFLQPVTHFYISQLIPHGLKVFLYDGYLHAKTIQIDGVITGIGSVNLDIRSLEVDDEVQMLFYGQGFGERHQAVLAEDMLRCKELDYEAFMRRGTWVRVKERLFQLFAPLM